MRLFVAVRTTDDNRSAMARAGSLFAYIPGFRPVAAGSIHLTLKFLGDLAEADLPRLKECLSAAAAGARRFDLAPRDLLLLPTPRSPRVAAVGLAEIPEPLRALQSAVEAAADSVGVPREARLFTAHFTVGRFKLPAAPAGLAAAAERFGREVAPLFAAHPVDAFDLVGSTLAPAGPVYESIASFPLAVPV